MGVLRRERKGQSNDTGPVKYGLVVYKPDSPLCFDIQPLPEGTRPRFDWRDKGDRR